MRHLTSITFITAVLLSSPAWAAVTIQSVTPEVSINRGQGYKEVVTAATEASAGDQVMAGPGGHGKIVYSDGCVVDVYPGAVVTVQASCKAAKPMMLGETCDPKELNCPPAVPGTPLWVYPAAAALIVGAMCVGFCEAEHHEEHHHEHAVSASP